MRCPIVYKADLVTYVHSLNNKVPITKIRNMSKRQLIAIWYSNNQKF